MKKREDQRLGAKMELIASIFKATGMKLYGLHPAGRYRDGQAMRKNFAVAYGIVDIEDFNYVAITLVRKCQ